MPLLAARSSIMSAGIGAGGAASAWALYDWANSAFTTLVVTFIYSTWFCKAMAPDEVTGTAWWSRAVAVSALLTAVLSPILGAAGDRAGARKRLLATTTTLCIAATALLGLIAPGLPYAALIALGLFAIADCSFETSYTFYNAFLPEIASPGRIGRVSGYGWGLGYVGGLVCMAIALVGFASKTPWFGMSTAEGFNYRAINLLVAGWFGVFCLPLFCLGKGQPNAFGLCRTVARARSCAGHAPT
jgi:UMF1 family MFS transporter